MKGREEPRKYAYLNVCLVLPEDQDLLDWYGRVPVGRRSLEIKEILRQHMRRVRAREEGGEG